MKKYDLHNSAFPSNARFERGEDSLTRDLDPEKESLSDGTALARSERRFKQLIGAAAGLSFVASVGLWFLVSKQEGLFVGLWVPSILSLGAFLLAGDKSARKRR